MILIISIIWHRAIQTTGMKIGGKNKNFCSIPNFNLFMTLKLTQGLQTFCDQFATVFILFSIIQHNITILLLLKRTYLTDILRTSICLQMNIKFWIGLFFMTMKWWENCIFIKYLIFLVLKKNDILSIDNEKYE